MANIAATGDRNIWAAVTRAARITWFGGDSTITEHPPHCLNNESVKTVNNAGTAYLSLIKADATDSIIVAGGRQVYNSVAKVIVDGAATSLFDVALPQNAWCGGRIDYVVTVGDGTDFQALTGIVTYAAVSKVAVQTLTITELATTQAKAVSSGTLTLAWTFVTGTLKGTVKLQPTGSLTETIYNITYSVTPTLGAITIL